MKRKTTKTDRVGVLPTRQKPHPQHLARVITSMMSGQAIGWSIYPEQLPAMERVIARRIERHRYGRTIAAISTYERRRQTATCRALARELLDLIGLAAVSVPTAAKKVRQ